MCGICGIGREGSWGRAYVLVSFECLGLTSALAGTHLCDCGVIRRLEVLGVQQQRAGAREFHGERGGGEGGGGGDVRWAGL